MRDGAIVEPARPTSSSPTRSTAYTRQLLDAIPNRKAVAS